MENNEPLGLENLGNTCFMNSALQCLARTKQLIPKLELFGSGNKLVLLVSNAEKDAQVTVVSESPISDNNEEEDNESSVQPISEEGQGDSDQESFKIAMVITPDSMTAKLKHCFKAITRCHDANPGSESYEQRNFLSRQGGYYYGYRPYDIHNMIGKHFRPGQQHDSHELLRTIVDFMKKDQTRAFRLAIMKHFGVAKNGEGSDPKMVELVKSLDQKVKHKTFIDEIFGGELMTTQTCLTCRSVKRSHEEFLDLSLPIRVSKPTRDSESGKNTKPVFKKYSLFDDDDNIVINRTVEECLQAFTEPSVLTGSNVVECENCHKINLAKVKAGANFEDIFPNVKKLLEEKEKEKMSSPANQPNKGKNATKKEARKKKRAARQNKSKGQQAKIDETTEKENETPQPQPGPSTSCSSSITLVENHFKHPSDMKNDEAHENNKETKLFKITPEQTSECSDDYVIIPSNNASQGEPEPECAQFSVEKVEGGNQDEYEHVEYSPEAMEEEPTLIGQKFESMEDININRTSKSDNEGEDDDDDDLPPPLEGIGHDSDEEEGNGVAPLADLLDLPEHDKFEHFHLPSEDEYEVNNVSETEVEKGTTADEGFSEGENSASVENETQVPGPSKDNGPSDSSSRTSTSDLVFVDGSDSDENSKSSSASAPESGMKIEGLPNIKIPITKCPCSRQQNISRPPEFLTIHLKRFQITNRGYTSKLGDHVEFPVILDLTAFCISAEDEQHIEHRKDTIFDEDGQVMYALYGIVEHSGSIHWGHYVAYVLCRLPPSEEEITDGKEGKEKWYHISDSHVSPSSEHSVKNRDPYILFYERIRGDEKKKHLEKQKSMGRRNEPAESILFSTSTAVINGWDESPADSSSKTDATSNWISNWNNQRPEQEENWDAPSPSPMQEAAEISENVGKVPLMVTDTGTCVWENQTTKVDDNAWGQTDSPAMEQNDLTSNPPWVANWGDQAAAIEEASLPTESTSKSTPSMLWTDLDESSSQAAASQPTDVPTPSNL